MVVIVFRSRLRQDLAPGLDELGEKMYSIAVQMPGFVSYKDFQAADGEIVTIVEFESLETLAAWRDHPEHKIAQQQGCELYFTEYHIQVCTTNRDYRFKRDEDLQ